VTVDNLNEEIRECLRYAKEHARQAKEVSRPNLREDFLEMGRRWPTATGLRNSVSAPARDHASRGSFHRPKVLARRRFITKVNNEVLKPFNRV
jgi:hypothetical protein